MTKSEFLNSIQNRLEGMPEEEIKKSVDYFSEMIDDRMEDGMGEEEAVAEIGTVDDAIKEILDDIPLSAMIKARAKKERTLKTWQIVLISVTSPIWVPLGIAAIAVIFALYIALWACVIAFFAVDLALFVSGIASVIVGVASLFQAQIALPLMAIGAGLILIGGSVMLFIPLLKLAKQCARLAKTIVLWIKSWFIRRDRNE